MGILMVYRWSTLNLFHFLDEFLKLYMVSYLEFNLEGEGAFCSPLVSSNRLGLL